MPDYSSSAEHADLPLCNVALVAVTVAVAVAETAAVTGAVAETTAVAAAATQCLVYSSFRVGPGVCSGGALPAFSNRLVAALRAAPRFFASRECNT